MLLLFLAICVKVLHEQIVFCSVVRVKRMERKNMDFSAITDKLRNLGYKVSEFETARDAAEYLGKEIKNKTVGFGGSITLEQTV